MSYSGENSTELTKLELDVARWRSVRKLPCQMPRDLWERAATLAEYSGPQKLDTLPNLFIGSKSTR